VGTKSTITVANASMDDYFCYSKAAYVDINNMDYSITTKTTKDTYGGNVIYQQGGSISCDNLIVEDSSIDKGIYVCDNSEVKISNSCIRAKTVGLEAKSSLPISIKDSKIYSSNVGIKSTDSSMKIDRCIIDVSGSSSSVIA
jgi:NDP-sugar pyrophosphorylase family protein